jgi:hypothetical protein
VRDVTVSYDGNKLLFSLRLPEIEDAEEEDQPTWNIWEYDIEEGRLRRIIDSDNTAEEGQDRFPAYLPDGRIVFSSTRQRQAKARLVDEGKDQYPAIEDEVDEPAMVLHVMNDDGTEIEQISFNQSHDLAPSVLDNGRIVFSRWNNFDGLDAISLYQVNPDGTGLQLLYGINSHDTGTNDSEVHFLLPRELPNGRLLVGIRPFTGTFGGMDLVVIDTPNYVENDQPTWDNLGANGPAQRSATPHSITTDSAVSPGGFFSSAFPLWDGADRLLVSWSLCRLQEGSDIVPCTADRLAADPVAAPPLYGIYIYDVEEGTQLPIVRPQEGVVYTDLVAAKDRQRPAIIPDTTEDPTNPLVEEQVGA